MLSVGPALFPKKLFGSVYRIRIGINKVAEYVSNLDPDPQLGLLVVLCIITYQGLRSTFNSFFFLPWDPGLQLWLELHANL